MQPIPELPRSEKYETRILSVVVVTKGDPIFSETVTTITICDEAAGEYVRVSQVDGHNDNAKCLVFDQDEWPVVRDAVNMMIEQCCHEVDDKPEQEGSAEP